MQDQLDRIERTLKELTVKVDELLKKRKASGEKRKSKTALHDEAVAGATMPFDDAHFQQTWLSYCDMRREQRKYLTTKAVEALLKKLGGYPMAVALTALANSIMNSWTGVFPESVCQAIKVEHPDDRRNYGL